MFEVIVSDWRQLLRVAAGTQGAAPGGMGPNGAKRAKGQVVVDTPGQVLAALPNYREQL